MTAKVCDRSTQQILWKQSLKRFCHITIVCFSSSFFLTIDMDRPAKFAGFFFIDEAIHAKLWAVPNIYIYWEKAHSVWFCSPLHFFHTLTGICIHGVSLPSTKAVIYLYIFKGFFHSQFLFYWKILVAIKTAEVSQCCWGVVYVSLLKKLFEHF